MEPAKRLQFLFHEGSPFVFERLDPFGKAVYPGAKHPFDARKFGTKDAAHVIETFAHVVKALCLPECSRKNSEKIQHEKRRRDANCDI